MRTTWHETRSRHITDDRFSAPPRWLYGEPSSPRARGMCASVYRLVVPSRRLLLAHTLVPPLLAPRRTLRDPSRPLNRSPYDTRTPPDPKNAFCGPQGQIHPFSGPVFDFSGPRVILGFVRGRFLPPHGCYWATSWVIFDPVDFAHPGQCGLLRLI